MPNTIRGGWDAGEDVLAAPLSTGPRRDRRTSDSYGSDRRGGGDDPRRSVNERWRTEYGGDSRRRVRVARSRVMTRDSPDRLNCFACVVAAVGRIYALNDFSMLPDPPSPVRVAGNRL